MDGMGAIGAVGYHVEISPFTSEHVVDAENFCRVSMATSTDDHENNLSAGPSCLIYLVLFR